jgi:hypothetical protein
MLKKHLKRRKQFIKDLGNMVFEARDMDEIHTSRKEFINKVKETFNDLTETMSWEKAAVEAVKEIIDAGYDIPQYIGRWFDWRKEYETDPMGCGIFNTAYDAAKFIVKYMR